MNQDEMKQAVAAEVATLVKSGQLIGVGTGSTVNLAIKEIAKKVKDKNLKAEFVCSSQISSQLVLDLGLTAIESSVKKICDWGFDGADEVDPKRRVIKGRGGAMLREKILASRCKKFIILVDETKLVDKLGSKKLIPVEFIPEAFLTVEKGLENLNCKEVTLRQAKSIDGPVITEKGNMIFDVKFSEISNDLENKIKQITGVVESGLFLTQVDEVWVAKETGIQKF